MAADTKSINIKNQTYYFFKWMINVEFFLINIEVFDRQKVVQKHWYWLHWIHHNYENDDYENIYSVNFLHLIIGEVDGHIEEKNGSKYLVFDSADENKEVLKKYTELWDGITNKIKTINGGKKGEYGKDFMKIKFDTDDNLPLNKPLTLRMLA